MKQTSPAWYEERESFLRSIGCTGCALDPHLYLQQRDDKTTIILVFVDDLLLTGNAPDRSHCQSTPSALTSQFKYDMNSKSWTSTKVSRHWLYYHQHGHSPSLSPSKTSAHLLYTTPPRQLVTSCLSIEALVTLFMQSVTALQLDWNISYNNQANVERNSTGP